MAVPAQPKIYHICHVDRLPSIIASAGLLSDAVLLNQALPGTVIGMNHIKQRRLQLELDSHPGLHVGECVPFYFCPRSVMLYLIFRQHQDLTYKGGQGPIVHLEADLHATVQWANVQARRWAFTLSNAGSNYFEDRADLAQLNEINWDAVAARIWHQCKEPKQAEFLLEQSFPWHLVERIGVQSRQIYTQVANALPAQGHRPTVELRPEWYY
ncbi:DUF4433 domain-containing protein [Pseudomonas aeruginosa]|uniref:type II toxin-antitoxin system toxin DNA ADP-ribosyl transferase DarT n=1 Tax=Pseudomonas aeruginosa TaxID=287 RepID=UPI00050F5CF5|nr:DUF4433 domain-containing protein [Pseudomonas aeruginosa]HEM6834850.1 DUF4433 domain-containing protein [Citrobacter koseri]KGD87197.1 hypothetical protein JL38_28765 [Pseudomonas aeruginosa]MBI7433895.1 DUF4433 domain-containing protein [Pseudomonas aeruginosa]MBX5521844.1 DUF4433 domain-containing protein [Pseudomonas aeruginosa]MDI4124926.1 DUF4433 domain-containing protein [Pseudomonas aeruginosa]